MAIPWNPKGHYGHLGHLCQLANLRFISGWEWAIWLYALAVFYLLFGLFFWDEKADQAGSAE